MKPGPTQLKGAMQKRNQTRDAALLHRIQALEARVGRLESRKPLCVHCGKPFTEHFTEHSDGRC